MFVAALTHLRYKQAILDHSVTSCQTTEQRAVLGHRSDRNSTARYKYWTSTVGTVLVTMNRSRLPGISSVTVVVLLSSSDSRAKLRSVIVYL